MTTQPIIRFENVTKKYNNDTTVLNGVSFEMERGKFYTLLGPSGCGKTTILRLIAGFIEPTDGTIFFNGKKLIMCLPMNAKLTQFFKTMRYFHI